MTLRDRFEVSAENYPFRTAVQSGRTALTYRRLRERVLACAEFVTRSLGHRPKCVAVVGTRSLTSYSGILATLYAGATYVPINVKNPASRLASILEQANCEVLIVDRAGLLRLREIAHLLDKSQVILVPDATFEEIASIRLLTAAKVVQPVEGEGASTFVPPALSSEDVAYIMFTSGSTGAPKGVPIRHRNADAFFEAIEGAFTLKPEDRLSQTFDISFDLSVFDLFAAWSAGAAVVSASDADLLNPAAFVGEQKISVWFSVPSVAAAFAERGKPMPQLRLSLFCGEALTRKTAYRWMRLAPNARTFNLYGPTEATIACSVFEVPQNALLTEETIAIGQPLCGTELIILNDANEPVERFEKGHLHIGGEQLFDGYLTAPSVSPFVRYNGKIFYRTGDLARELPNGELAFLGRSDTQIKLRGYRIELGEIEAAYLSQPEIDQVVILATSPSDESTCELAAFIKGRAADPEQIRKTLARLLPSYMLPKFNVVVEEFPLNANRKIDRRQLFELAQGRLQSQHA